MLKIFYTSDFSNSLSILSGSYLLTYLDLPIYLIYYLFNYLFIFHQNHRFADGNRFFDHGRSHNP